MNVRLYTKIGHKRDQRRRDKAKQRRLSEDTTLTFSIISSGASRIETSSTFILKDALSFVFVVLVCYFSPLFAGRKKAINHAGGAPARASRRNKNKTKVCQECHQLQTAAAAAAHVDVLGGANEKARPGPAWSREYATHSWLPKGRAGREDELEGKRGKKGRELESKRGRKEGREEVSRYFSL